MEQTPRTHWAAPLSLALGIAALPWLGIVAAVPALVLGFVSLRTINASDGTLRGAWMAVAGLAAGAVGVMISALGVIAMLTVSVRTTAARAECLNNLRVVGIALNQYADLHETFPPATLGPGSLPPEKQVAWTAGVIPHLAGAAGELNQRRGARLAQAYMDLDAAIDRRSPWDAEVNAAAREAAVGFFLCPGHPGYTRQSAVTHYVGIAGVDEDAARLSRDDAKAGVFGYDRGVRRQEATAGFSFTLAALETGHENGPWLAGGFATVRGVGEGDDLLGPGRPFGGLHPKVTNALMLDGSARSINDGTEGGLLRRLATLRRGE